MKPTKSKVAGLLGLLNPATALFHGAKSVKDTAGEAARLAKELRRISVADPTKADQWQPPPEPGRSKALNTLAAHTKIWWGIALLSVTLLCYAVLVAGSFIGAYSALVGAAISVMMALTHAITAEQIRVGGPRKTSIKAILKNGAWWPRKES
mgnify:CR=1 FL=1